jgi:hypothetical protein
MGRCPTCNSPAPHRHPALGFEGEVHTCVDAFHLTDTPENRRYIPMVQAEIARRDGCKADRVYP